MKARCFAVVPAAGRGRRMGAEIPKQYLTLAGKPILQHTLERLLAVPELAVIVVALAADDRRWRDLPLAAHPRIRVTQGGAERADSVLAGLRCLETEAADSDWVLVHDAARPCLRPADVEKLRTALAGDAVGGILALPSVDTLKEVEDGLVRKTLARHRIWRALTPQMFRYRLLRQSLEQALRRRMAVTDESSAVELAGFRPRIVEGSPDNIKITRPEDLPLARFILERL